MYLYEGIEKAEKKLRAVLLGCGEQAVNMIHNAISYLDEIEVVAVCDKNKERADFAARRLGLSRSYQDAGRMLDEVDADAALSRKDSAPHPHLLRSLSEDTVPTKQIFSASAAAIFLIWRDT